MLLILTNYYQVKLTKNLSEHKTLFFWLAMIWSTVVAFLCLMRFDFNALPTSTKNLDKIGHFVFHFGIVVWWFLYFNYKTPRIGFNYAITKAFFLSLVYGIVIEICQGVFTLTRKADFYDILANTTGAIGAIIMIVIVSKLFKTNSL